MTEKTEREEQALLQYWDRAFSLDEAEKARLGRSGTESWKEHAPSGKLFEAAASLGRRKKVLDYGCGNGWAAIIAAKMGCTDVTAADPAPTAVEAARLWIAHYGVGDSVRAVQASARWLEEEPSETYDGLFCSNVLDVVPRETADRILREAARVVTRNARVIVGLNYYLSPEKAALKGIALAEGNCLYSGGVLRLVSRTDEEWSDFFSPFFSVERLTHFAWPGEAEETRRLFYLRRKA